MNRLLLFALLFSASLAAQTVKPIAQPDSPHIGADLVSRPFASTPVPQVITVPSTIEQYKCPDGYDVYTEYFSAFTGQCIPDGHSNTFKDTCPPPKVTCRPTVKPALPTKDALTPASEAPISTYYSRNAFVAPTCGWQGRELDNGQCLITVTAPPDYEGFNCVLSPRKQGEPYVVSCTWKPSKGESKP